MGSAELQELSLDEKAILGLTRFFSRTGWEPVHSDKPFDEAIQAEPDHSDEEAGEYEVRQRIVGVMAFLRFITARGTHPAAMLKQLAAAGRACHVAPFHMMTMTEVGLMFGETRAAHSWRCKILSKEIRLSGQLGSKLPGQKSAASSESYKKSAKGNTNRLGKRKQRQGSFFTEVKQQNNNKIMITLGVTYIDKITGFQGVATGYVRYITGCNQVLLAPRVGADGASKLSEWFDEQRCSAVPKIEPVRLDNGKTPGFDRPAPRH